MQTVRCWKYGTCVVIGIMLSLLRGTTPCQAGIAGGTDAKGDPIERVDVTVGRALYFPGGLYGSPCIGTDVGVRLGDVTQYQHLTACWTDGGRGLGVTAPVFSGQQAPLFTGASSPDHGSSSISASSVNYTVSSRSKYLLTEEHR